MIFLDSEENKGAHFIDWDKVKNSKSSVDKWIGVLEGIDIKNWKTHKREYLEEKHG